MNTTTARTSTQERNWVARNGWVLAAVWLAFLAFPWLSILSDEDTSSATKVAVSLVLAVFVVVYIDAFRWQQERDEQTFRGHPHGEPAWDGHIEAGRAHFVVLVVLNLVAYLLGGPAALGVVPFVIAVGVFTFSWPMAWAVLITGVAVNVLVPLATGDLDELWFLALIAASVGGASALIRVVETHQAEQAQLRTTLAISDERSRVARDVHDVLGHSLTAMILKVELCKRLLDLAEEDSESGREKLDLCRQQLLELESVGRSALAEVRSTVGGLRAANLADELTVARSVLADAGVELLVTGEASQVPDAQRSTLAWVVREAVTNIVRHANASVCRIDLVPGDSVMLRISDDGVGIGTSAEGNGLTGLRERVAAAGAELRVISSGDGSSNTGTALEVGR